MDEKQASKNYIRPFVGGYSFQIIDVTFTLNTFNASCKEIGYLCASFGTSDILDKGNGSSFLPFIVYGVEAENDSTPNSVRLVGCSPFITCNGKVYLPFYIPQNLRSKITTK